MIALAEYPRPPKSGDTFIAIRQAMRAAAPSP